MKISEHTIFTISAIFVLLAYYAFQKDLGVGLALLIYTTYFLFLRDKRVEIFIEKKANKLKSILMGIILWVSALVITSITAPLIGLGRTNFTMVLQSVVNVQQSIASMIFSEALPLAGNMILTMLAIGIFFPINETFFVGVLYEKLKEKIREPFRKTGIRSIGAMGLIATLMVFYHFGAKGISDKLALWSVFVFFSLTLIMIIWEGQMLGAMFGHILNNTVALAVFYALFSVQNVAALAIFIGIISLIFFFSLEKTNFRIVKTIGG